MGQPVLSTEPQVSRVTMGRSSLVTGTAIYIPWSARVTTVISRVMSRVRDRDHPYKGGHGDHATSHSRGGTEGTAGCRARSVTEAAPISDRRDHQGEKAA